MSEPTPNQPAAFAPAQAAEEFSEVVEHRTAGSGGPERPRVGGGYVWLLIIATFTGYVALVAPIGISLALRMQELVREDVEILGYVIGAGAAVAAISQPLVGMWSDRTRTRFGRRRPFALGGALVGVAGLTVIAFAPNIWMVAAGWMITQLGFSSANGSLLLSQADRLPPTQRGRVAGYTGLVQMLASVIGVVLASAFIGSTFLVFLVPGLVGLVGVIIWVLFNREPSSIDLPTAPRLNAGRVIANMVFKPSEHPSFAWNWLARLFFYFGITFATTFVSLFFAARLSEGGKVAEIGGLIAIVSLLGVGATAGGALLGGLLSDKLLRRRLFVLMSGIIFSIGALLMAFGGSDATILFVGSILVNLGLGVFAAVDQAIVLDILPSAETEAGRFIGINNYSISLAQTLAPILAVPLLLIGVSGADKNYGLVFVVAAACTLVGGVLVMTRVRGTN